MTRIIRSLVIFTFALTIHSISLCNSRLPWRNPSPPVRLNPKIESHRQQSRIKEWHRRVKKYLKDNQPEKALNFLKETLKLDSKNHYSLGMTSYLLLTFQKILKPQKRWRKTD